MLNHQEFCILFKPDGNVTHLLSNKSLTLVFSITVLPELKHDSTAPSAGHSHQLFHVCGILGTHFQMKAIEQDMVTRRHWLLQHSIPITFSNSLGAALLCVVLNLSIIFLFSLPLLTGPICQEKKNDKRSKVPSVKSCAHC